jgi:hypothetical protein
MLATRAKAIKNNPNNYLEGQKTLYDTFVKECHFTDELHNIKCPALIIVGDQDFLKPIKFSQILADKIPNSEFIILPNCGHVSIFEKPKELQSMLFGFIEKHQYTFPVFYDVNKNAQQSYGVRSLPTTYLINKNFEIIRGGSGMINYDLLAGYLDEVLGE